MAQILRLSEQVTEICRREEDALRSRDLAVLKQTTNDKVRVLLELSKNGFQLYLDSEELNVTEKLDEMMRELQNNHDLLEMHFRALAEVSKIVSDAIAAEESDGTYTKYIDRFGCK